jgi:TPR repeat protein
LSQHLCQHGGGFGFAEGSRSSGFFITMLGNPLLARITFTLNAWHEIIIFYLRSAAMLSIVRIICFSLLALSAQVVLAESAESIRQEAAQGSPQAQAKLAALYLLGREGVEKDEALAAEWMEKSANQGVVDAQVVMGALYDRGIGVMADRDKATKWYEKAAAKGHGTSLAILGKNEAAAGSVQFNYQAMRLSAARSIPTEYAKRFLTGK